MYAVVETINNLRQKEVSVVLSSWIIDEEYIYWPPNHYKALKKMLTPDVGWTKHSCVVLKRNIATYSEAKTREKFLSENSCSEVDEGSTRLIAKHNFNTEFDQNYVQTAESNFNSLEMVPANPPGEMLNGKFNNSGTTEFTEKNVRLPLTIELPPQIPKFRNNSSKQTEPTALISLEQTSVSLDREIENAVVEKLNYICNEIKKIKKHSKYQTEVIKEQNCKIETLQKEFAKTSQSIENFISSSIIGQQKIRKITKDHNFVYPNVPIKTVEELDLLNAKLIENYYMEQMVIRLYKYRTININKAVKQMFEHLIHYNIIKLYSWTGQSGIAKGIHKLIFLDLNMIIQLVENTVNYLNLDAPITTEETKKAIQQFLKRSSIVMARMAKK